MTTMSSNWWKSGNMAAGSSSQVTDSRFVNPLGEKVWQPGLPSRVKLSVTGAPPPAGVPLKSICTAPPLVNSSQSLIESRSKAPPLGTVSSVMDPARDSNNAGEPVKLVLWFCQRRNEFCAVSL